MAFKVAFDSTHNSKQTYFVKITDRARPRIVQNAWGWSIDHFIDLRELLTAIRDAIRDHQRMHKHGVLHRNVSAGNILIRPAPPDSKSSHLSLSELVSTTEGQLIGLDHAKHVKSMKDPRLAVNAASDECNKAIRCIYNESVAVHAFRLVFEDDAFSYCAKAIALNVLGLKPIDTDATATASDVLASKPKSQWTAADLGWEHVGEVPDYASHTSIVNERTGTIPFVSHKLMAGNIYAIHNAIHDLESFWWVIIYLCLTRESGGGHQRQNVPEKVQHLVDDLFHNSSARVGFKKALYFGKDSAVHFKELLELFSDYFEPLKPMLTRWRGVLALGYNYKAYEYYLVHKYVLAIIADALGGLLDKEETPVIQNELERRAEQYAVIHNVDRSYVQLGRSRPSTIMPAGLSEVRENLS